MTHILVVEDSADMRSLLKTSLESAGYSVQVAADGHSALAMQGESPADIVITDLFMPNGNGFEAITALRQRYPSVKIIAMSGAEPQRKTDYFNAAEILGANATLRKPFHPDALLKLIASLD